jgi:hypothetical protein
MKFGIVTVAAGLFALSTTLAAQTQVQPGQSPGGGQTPPGVNGQGMSAPLTDNRAAAGSDQSSFNGWMGTYATKNNGYVSRQAYLDEAGRRWDSMDRNHRGLTTEQINQMYGYGPATPTIGQSPGRANNNPNKGGD